VVEICPFPLLKWLLVSTTAFTTVQAVKSQLVIITNLSLLVGAKLIPYLYVDDDGRPETSTAVSDTTGGLAAKMAACVSVVRASDGRVAVLMCSLRDSAFSDACVLGHWQSRDSVGTVVALSH